MADIAAGVAAHSAILAALLRRERTGRGAALDISMLEAMVEWMGFPLYYALDGAPPPARAGAGHATIYPYGPFATADGMVLFGLQNDREWQSFATTVLLRPDLAADPRFVGNDGRARHRDVLQEVIGPIFAALPTADAVERLEAAGIGNGRVNTLDAVWGHPQLAARGRWGEVGTPEGPVPSLRAAPGSDWEARLDPVPALDAHGQALRAEFAPAPSQGASA